MMPMMNTKPILLRTALRLGAANSMHLAEASTLSEDKNGKVSVPYSIGARSFWPLIDTVEPSITPKSTLVLVGILKFVYCQKKDLSFKTPRPNSLRQIFYCVKCATPSRMMVVFLEQSYRSTFKNSFCCVHSQHIMLNIANAHRKLFLD